MDSKGVKSDGEEEWNAASTALKHSSMLSWVKGGPKRYIWFKIHIGIDEEMLEIWAFKVMPTTWVIRPCCLSC